VFDLQVAGQALARFLISMCLLDMSVPYWKGFAGDAERFPNSVWKVFNNMLVTSSDTPMERAHMISYVNSKCTDLNIDRQTLYLTVVMFPDENQYTFFNIYFELYPHRGAKFISLQTTRTNLAASERDWRLPSPPIVGKTIRFSYVN